MTEFDRDELRALAAREAELRALIIRVDMLKNGFAYRSTYEDEIDLILGRLDALATAAPNIARMAVDALQAVGVPDPLPDPLRRLLLLLRQVEHAMHAPRPEAAPPEEREPPRPTTPEDKPAGEQLGAVGRALAIIIEAQSRQQSLTITAIASKAGCSREYLSKSKLFQDAYRAFKASHAPPRGRKVEGRVEASSDES